MKNLVKNRIESNRTAPTPTYNPKNLVSPYACNPTNLVAPEINVSYSYIVCAININTRLLNMHV